MTVGDFLAGGGGFHMTHLDTFTRRRATTKADPYDADSVIEDWEHPDEIEVRGFLSSGMSSEQPDAVRSELVTTAQLIIQDPDADVQRGDEIAGATGTWRVQGIVERDMNPFTGWKPTLVCNLQEVTG